MTLVEDFKNFDFFYVARQPIFDKNGSTYGYELLFRTGIKDSIANIDDGDFATMCVATCGFSKSQEILDQSKRIFINFTENLILQGAPRALPPTVLVIEVLENTLPSPQVKENLISLKQDGYFIAIDDFEGGSHQEDLLDIADIIKVDVLGKTQHKIEDIFSKIKNKKALKVAEKIDTLYTYALTRDLGFDFFQGFFFARPENLAGRKLHSSQSSKLRILATLNEPEIEIDTLVNLIKVDPSIIYRLLRLINSVAFGFSMKIESVRHAVTLLGTKRVTYWLRMVVLSDIASPDKPQELFLMALTRGRVLELLATDKVIKEENSENMFLFGMLSLIDVMLETPFSRIINKLPLSAEMVKGYMDKDSKLAQYLKLVTSLEDGDTKKFCTLCNQLQLEKQKVAKTSLLAHEWTDQVALSIT